MLFRSSARDDVHHFSIEEALSSPKAKGVLDSNIKLSFGSGMKGGIIKSGLTANKKTKRRTQIQGRKKTAKGRSFIASHGITVVHHGLDFRMIFDREHNRVFQCCRFNLFLRISWCRRPRDAHSALRSDSQQED